MIARTIIAGLICGLVMCVSGCEGHPKGMDELRPLTEAEKEKIVETAFETPEAKGAEERYEVYTIKFGWTTIRWNEEGEGPGRELTSYDSNAVEYPDKITRDMEESYELFAEVELIFGDPPEQLVRVAVNPETGKAANVFTVGLKKPMDYEE